MNIMITDALTISLVKENLYNGLKDDFLNLSYKFNKKLEVTRKVKNDHEIILSILYNNYYPVKYEIYFNGGVAIKSLLEPLEMLYKSMEEKSLVKPINNYLWSVQLHMGDFNPEFRQTTGAYKNSSVLQFESVEGMHKAIVQMKSFIFDYAIPTINILVRPELLKKNIFEIGYKFRDDYLTVYSLLVFMFIYDRDNFESFYDKTAQTTAQIRATGVPLSNYFDHLQYVKSYLYSTYK
jgi:hypothetical protein